VTVPYEIVVKQLDPQPVASIVIPGIGSNAVGAALHGALPEVFSHLQANGIAPAGPPFARYHGGAGDTLDLEVGIPVPPGATVPETDEVKARTLPGGEAVTTIHTGPYDELPEALRALAEWKVANGRVAGGLYWESYLDDPSTVPRDQVRTELFEPLAPEDS
jgi:effector-binding domain-containing protein